VQGHKGQLSVGTLAAVAAVVGGAGAASAALWWFSRRFGLFLSWCTLFKIFFRV